MTYLKLLPKVRIHPVLIAFVFIAFLTGTFMELSVIIMIVFFHELGHFIAARLFKWRITHITLWVFGGVMDTEEHGNRPLREEAIVILAGPLQHLFIYLMLNLFTTYHVLSPSIIDLIFYYNTAILLFNLLPIWPLDGGKLLFIFLSAVLPYRKAHNYIIVFSIILSILILLLPLIFLKFTLSAVFIMIFLLIENHTEWKQRFYVFIRFLLQRYEGHSTIKAVHPLVVSHKEHLMEVFVRFRRDKKHSIYIAYPNQPRKFIDEMDCLRHYFYYKDYDKTVGEIARGLN